MVSVGDHEISFLLPSRSLRKNIIISLEPDLSDDNCVDGKDGGERFDMREPAT